MSLSADQPSETGSRESRHTDPGPGAQRGSRATPTSREGHWDERRENGGRWTGWVVAEVHRGGQGRRSVVSKGSREAGASGRGACICGLPSSSESCVEIHGYHHHRELGGQMRRLGTLGQPPDNHSSLPHSPQGPHLSRSTSRWQSQTTICPTCSCQWHGRCARSNPGERDGRGS